MALPFTSDQFFEVFQQYNTAIWPVQYVAYALAFVALGLASRSDGERYIIAILAVFWLWIGSVYHITFFARINPAAYAFGALFIVQGLLFLRLGYIRGGVGARPWHRPSLVTGLCFIAFALVVYPAISIMRGHTYPAMPTFGLTPCPTTIFTFGLLLLPRRRVPVHVLIIPALWSVIGTTAAVLLSVPQDYALGVAAVIGIPLILTNNGRISTNAADSSSND